MVVLRYGAESEIARCIGALVTFASKVSVELRKRFEEITKISFEAMWERARRFFGEHEDPQAAAFTAIALRALLFDDPALEKRGVEGLVKLGSETLASDAAVVFLEVLSVALVPPEGVSYLLVEPITELSRAAKSLALGAYAVVYEREVLYGGEDWAKTVRAALGEEAQPLLTLEDHEAVAFEAAKVLAAEEAIARINVEAAAERLWDLIRGEGSFIAARAKRAKALSDGERLYHPEDFAAVGHEHPEYLREGEAAENAYFLEEDGRRYTISDFALEDHEHPEFLKVTDVTNAHFLITSDGKVLSPYDLAPANHVHPDYLVVGEPALAAKAFTDGKRLYFPEDFAPLNHAEDPEYVKKNPAHDYLKRTDVAENTRALQGFPLSYFALADHTHPEFLSYEEADKLFRLSSEPLDVVEEVRGFVVRWF